MGRCKEALRCVSASNACVSDKETLKWVTAFPVVRGRDATPETFVEVAQKAEASDLDALWLSAHVIGSPQVKPGIRWCRICRILSLEGGLLGTVYDLRVLAALTQRITLGTSVLVLPQHLPFEVAKQVAETDQLSNGRFEKQVSASAGSRKSLRCWVRTLRPGAAPMMRYV